MTTVSVVTSLYQSSPYVEEFFQRARDTVQACGLDYEFVFVDDGSTDDGAAKVLALRRGDDRVHLVRLSRNFGQQAAMMAGLRLATGDLVFAADIDLEERPEDFRLLFDTMTRERADAAFGVMRERPGGLVRRGLAGAFHALMSRRAVVDVVPNQLWARVMTRRFVDAVCQFRETHLFLGGLFALVGFRQIPVPLEKTFKKGTTYSFGKRASSAVDALASMTAFPSTAIWLTGATVAFLGLAVAITAALLRTGVAFESWKGLVIVGTLVALLGLVLVTQGLLGLVLGRLFIQAKGRPQYIVESSTLGAAGTRSES